MFELTTNGLELFGQLAASHPVVEEQGDGGGRYWSGSGKGFTPVIGVGLIVPCQLTPPTTLIVLALTTAPPLPSIAALVLLESTYMPQFALNVVLPFWE